MHQNHQSGLHKTNLGSHTTLLLTANPTIMTSPLQNNSSNNPQPNSSSSVSVTLVRRQPSTPLLASSNLDNDSYVNVDNFSNINSNEDFINFKKPQNEIFKKLDGKIQKIVAAHSNLNKLYALNDFSGLGAGPKRPFELPPQLPPPPPWIPKVTNEFNDSWNEDSMSISTDSRMNDTRPSLTMTESDRPLMDMQVLNRPQPQGIDSKPRSSNVRIDSAISKLHQRRQQQLIQRAPSVLTRPIKGPTPSTSRSSINSLPTQVSPDQFAQWVQTIKETIEATRNPNHQGGSMSDDDKKKFQKHLLAVLTKEIVAVTKEKDIQTRLKSNLITNVKPQQLSQQRSLLIKSSPQSLFNTIRRETSLLLNKLTPSARSNLSLLSNYQAPKKPIYASKPETPRQSIVIYNTIKVIAAPSENHQYFKFETSGGNDTAHWQKITQKDIRDNDASRLSYQVLRSKIRRFQEKNRIILGNRNTLSQQSHRKKASQASGILDKIVDQLQSKWTKASTLSNHSDTASGSKISHQSVSLLKAPSPMTIPTPIPVFRTLAATTRSNYLYHGSKAVDLKSKKSSRTLYFGLRLGNYIEKECPQPSNEKITLEQFTKCLDLVRSNDVSLQQHQEQLQQSETKWRLQTNNRPLRLRRIHGDRMHMPASASYKATRKVGLQ